ncbi:MAG: energy transducer TonB [Chitinophagaceae bacterium]|nr:energy transducer TonB [Chitinophagaceae bacterium]
MSLSAQEVKQYLLNRYFEVTTEEKEAFFIRLTQPYKGYVAYTDYDGKKRIVQTGFFTDSTFLTPIGPHKFYWEGIKLYEGIYVNGKPSGYWYFFDKKGKLSDSLHYIVTDSSKTIFSNTAANDEAKTKALQNEHLKKDTTNVFSKVESEAEFQGGVTAWQKYLLKNIDFPELVMNTRRQQKSTVMIQFVVCNDGEICSVEAINSFHPLLDLIAVNAIRKGPKWKPAMQNGKNVKAYRRQPITFVVPD